VVGLPRISRLSDHTRRGPPATPAALPGDAPIVAQAPADGATVAVDPDGIPVSFTCPVYRVFQTGTFVLPGGPKDYGVSMSQSSTLGADGRLADAVALTRATETPPTGSGQCTSALGAGGAQRPQETPGTYYWQAWRLCTGCTLGYETGPVRKLILRSNAKAKVKTPKRAWAGYPFALAVSLPGVGDRTPVRIERKAGKKWRKVATAQAIGERAEAVITLKRGRHTLRAVATIGSQAVTSAGRKLKVARAAGWRTSRSDDGAYRAKSVRFKVAGGGRQVKGFTAHVAMLCPSVTPGQFTTQIGTATVRTMKIAPDGGFIGAAKPDPATSILVRGKLHRGKVTQGRAQLSVGPCSGSQKFGARR
jgi:hypothetical protein